MVLQGRRQLLTISTCCSQKEANQPVLSTSLPMKKPAVLSKCWKLSMTALKASDLAFVHEICLSCHTINGVLFEDYTSQHTRVMYVLNESKSTIK